MATYPHFSAFFLMNVHLCHNEDGDGCGGLFANKFLKLTIENQLYVVKQFFNIGSGTMVSMQDNETFLTEELICLKTVDWFLNEFEVLVETNLADISTGWYSIDDPSGILNPGKTRKNIHTGFFQAL